MTVGEQIRTERLRRGLSIVGLARQIRVPAAYISHVERDQVQQPRCRGWKALLEWYGMALQVPPPRGDAPAIPHLTAEQRRAEWLEVRRRLAPAHSPYPSPLEGRLSVETWQRTPKGEEAGD